MTAADLLTPEQRDLVNQVSAVNEEAGRQMEAKFLVALADRLIHVGGEVEIPPPLPAPTDADKEREARQQQFAEDAAAAGKAERERIETEREEIGNLTGRLVKLALMPRHIEAYEFAVASSGLSAGEFMQQCLRQLSASWRQDMLEARGQGGSTTRKEQPKS